MPACVQRTQTGILIILFLALIAAIVGAAISWANKVPDEEAMLIALWLAVCVLNLVLHFLVQPAIGLASAALYLFLCDEMVSNLLTHARARQTALLTGEAMVMIGAMVTFVALPVNLARREWRHHWNILSVVFGCCLMGGNVMMWIDRPNEDQVIVSAFCLGLMYLVVSLLDFPQAMDSASVVACAFLRTFWIQLLGSSGVALAGLLLVNVSLIFLIVLQCYRVARNIKVAPEIAPESPMTSL